MTERPYQICTRCIMDTSDPDIVFDAHGHCNHCNNYFDNIWMKAWIPDEKGEAVWAAQVAKIKEECKHLEYDAIIGLSGGVDSSYLAYICRKKYDMRLLAVHVDGGWNAEIAVQNIEKIVTKLGIDLYTHVVDWTTMQDLQVAFFKSSVANQDVPQDHAFFSALYRTAIKKKLRYVLSGSNYATESILPRAWAYNAMDLRHLKSIHRLFGSRPLKSYPTVSFFQYYVYFPRIKGMKVLKPLNFMPYNKAEAIATLETELGWKNYGGKHFESRFTKFQQAHYRPKKFGYDERRAYLSSLIISGQTTREQALVEMAKEVYTPEDLAVEKEFVRKKLGLSKEDFEGVLAAPPRTFRDYPSNQWLFNLKDRLKSALASN